MKFMSLGASKHGKKTTFQSGFQLTTDWQFVACIKSRVRLENSISFIDSHCQLVSTKLCVCLQEIMLRFASDKVSYKKATIDERQFHSIL